MRKATFSLVLLAAMLGQAGPSSADLTVPEPTRGRVDQEVFQGERESAEGPDYGVLKSLSGIENLRVDLFTTHAVLQGELLTPEDMRRVEKVAQSLEGVVNLCTLHPEALEAAASFLNGRIGELRIRGLNLTTAGAGLMLTGTASESEKTRVLQLCAAFDLPVFDGTRGDTPDSRMVLFEVSFTEVSRDSFREIGVNWPTALPFTDRSGIRLDRLSPSLPLEMALNLLVQDGKARVLSRPRILCRSGESASFQAGGEIAIPKSDSEGGVSVAWKRYGIILEASPVVDGEGRIHARVVSEVSTVDRSNSVEGIPGILTRRIDTYLSLASGQSVVLSGLVSSEDGETIARIPVLGNLPVLGELFRSRSFQKRETELVVFLTPNLAGSEDFGEVGWPQGWETSPREPYDRHLPEKEDFDESEAE